MLIKKRPTLPHTSLPCRGMLVRSPRLASSIGASTDQDDRRAAISRSLGSLRMTGCRLHSFEARA
jgi:hypothetical protein